MSGLSGVVYEPVFWSDSWSFNKGIIAATSSRTPKKKNKKKTYFCRCLLSGVYSANPNFSNMEETLTSSSSSFSPPGYHHILVSISRSLILSSAPPHPHPFFKNIGWDLIPFVIVMSNNLLINDEDNVDGVWRWLLWTGGVGGGGSANAYVSILLLPPPPLPSFVGLCSRKFGWRF